MLIHIRMLIFFLYKYASGYEPLANALPLEVALATRTEFNAVA